MFVFFQLTKIASVAIALVKMLQWLNGKTPTVQSMIAVALIYVLSTVGVIINRPRELSVDEE